MPNVLINEVNVGRKITDALKAQKFVNSSRAAANTRFVIGHKILLDEYDNHEITKEIVAGPDAKGTILPGPGNLFAFLGFNKGTHPEKDLRLHLQDPYIKMDPKATFVSEGKKFTYQFNVTVPTIEDLYDITPNVENTPGKSWLEAIEKGIGSFAEFVYSTLIFKKISASKSKSALQLRTVNKDGRPDRVLKIPYLSDILKKFTDRFKK